MLLKKIIQPASVFDTLLIFIIPLFAYIVTQISISSDAFFTIFLHLNILFLGYHHVISTYTRICFSIKDFKRNTFLVVYLPLIIFPITFVMGKYIGVWTIATLYLYWQWFHYTRQSFGISRYYLKTKNKQSGHSLLNDISFYVFPLAGILYRSYQHPEYFLELPIKVIPVPYYAYLVVLIVSVICILTQLVSWIILLKKKELNIYYASYTICHYFIFLLGYLLIDDITMGWLCINVWHNAQYIFFVWLSNNKRFKQGYTKGFGLISKVSQKKHLDEYILLSLGITVLFYGFLNFTATHLENFTSLPLVIITFMTINFHHYVVDSIIWKKKNTQEINKIIH